MSETRIIETVEKTETKPDPFEGFVTETFESDDQIADDATKEPATDGAEDAEKDLIEPEKAQKDEGAEADKKADAKDEKRKPTAEERIAEITRKRREAERAASEKDDRIAALEARLAEVEGKKVEKKDLTTADKGAKSQSDAPNPNDFDYGELDSRYIAAREEHLLSKAKAEVKAELESYRQAEAAERSAQELKQKLDSQIAKGVSEFEDFEASLETLDKMPPVDLSIAQAIIESEQGHKIIDYLAKNAAEAAEMASRSPVEQARYLGKLEERFASRKEAAPKKEAKASQAPDPVQRARGSDGRFEVSADTDDFAAFEKAFVKHRA